MVKSLSAATQLFKRPCGLFKRHFRGWLKDYDDDYDYDFSCLSFFVLRFSF